MTRVATALARFALPCPAFVVVLLLASPSPAAAAAPQVRATWSTDVTATSANLHATVNPGGLNTTYRFEYLTRAKYLENGETFAGALRSPSSGETFLGFGTADEPAFAHLGGLIPSTAYEYRIVATNSESPGGGTPGEPRSLTTQESSPSFGLLDSRGWELVSPPEKNGGAIQGFGQNRGGDVLQAAAQGGAITYSSASSFGQPTAGAPPASQYISHRTGSGWATQNITAPTLSGVYGTEPIGVPYRIFSADLARGLMLNGVHCRGEGTGCPVDAPVLTGSGAPAGYQDYYLRDNGTSSFAALLSEANKGPLALSAEDFNLALAGASPDLTHVVLSSCAKLTSDATEVAGSEGCDPAKPNLYGWSGGQLQLINLLPGETHGTPGAKLAAQGAGAVSADGSRVYFTDGGNLYLREGTQTFQVDEAQGGGGSFQTAAPSGEVAFFTKEVSAGNTHLYRYSAATHTATDLTPTGGVEGVLGASEDGSYLYYASNGEGTALPPAMPGVYLWHTGSTSRVVAAPKAAAQSDSPPATGTARVSADGTKLLFLSQESEALSGYDNTAPESPAPCGSENEAHEKGICDSEVYLYDASANGGAGSLACLSCNPTGERPLGPSSIPGAIANGKPEAFGPSQILTDSYKPRVLSANGRRLFFDSSDSLVPGDTDNRPDVYEWEAQGEGSCAKPGGCLALVSSGRGAEGASFVDASADGSDAFFLTNESLVPADPGSADLYDARSGGGFPEPVPPLECVADACQPLPQAPEDPTVGTSIPGPPNPRPRYPKPQCPRGTHRVTRHGQTRCVSRHRHPAKRRRRGGR